jgi:hypothetical protein
MTELQKLQKKDMIKYITKTLKKYGEVNRSKLDLSNYELVEEVDNTKKIIDHFTKDGVTVLTIEDGQIINSSVVSYDSLSFNDIDLIEGIMDGYEDDMRDSFED